MTCSWVAVYPCGCTGSAMTGYDFHSEEEAARELAGDNWQKVTVELLSTDAAMSRLAECPHTPKWGITPDLPITIHAHDPEWPPTTNPRPVDAYAISTPPEPFAFDDVARWFDVPAMVLIAKPPKPTVRSRIARRLLAKLTTWAATNEAPIDSIPVTVHRSGTPFFDHDACRCDLDGDAFICIGGTVYGPPLDSTTVQREPLYPCEHHCHQETNQ